VLLSLILAACTNPSGLMPAPLGGPDPLDAKYPLEQGGSKPPEGPGGGTPPEGTRGKPPDGGSANRPVLVVEHGAGVLLSGEYSYAGAATGTDRVDFFRVGADGRPEILHAMLLDKRGHWELEVPRALGRIDILAFVDQDGGGPQQSEPSALLKDVDIQDQPLSHLDLVLVDGAPNEFATDGVTGKGAAEQ